MNMEDLVKAVGKTYMWGYKKGYGNEIEMKWGEEVNIDFIIVVIKIAVIITNIHMTIINIFSMLNHSTWIPTNGC